MAPYMIDYNKILACWAKQHKLDINVNELLNKSKGKEFKLCLRLSNQYGKPNPLNNIFQSRLESIDATNYRKLTELILSVFYPSELSEVDNLLQQYKGREKELISKLQVNFNACDVSTDPSSDVDYHDILTNFLKMSDPERLHEVDSILEKCKGRETILFAVLAKEYKLPNPLNQVFLARVQSIDAKDYLALTRLFLKIFNPKVIHRAEAFLKKYEGNEPELFAKLAIKFHAINPLQIIDGAIQSPAKTVSTERCEDSSNYTIQSPGIVA